MIIIKIFSFPEFGLSSLFIIALLSATLLPLGSEPMLLAVIQWQPEQMWVAIVIATLGNTLGGMINWWMGWSIQKPLRWQQATQWRAMQWLQRFGAKACLLSWLPVIGDPLCLLAGYLKLPLAACTLYMMLGKGLRYMVLAGVGVGVFKAIIG